MPKAMLITNTNLEKVSEAAKWNLQDSENLDGYWYVEDVQFSHGYVEAAIVTPQTFDSTFKIPEAPGNPEKELIPVEYKYNKSLESLTRILDFSQTIVKEDVLRVYIVTNRQSTFRAAFSSMDKAKEYIKDMNAVQKSRIEYKIIDTELDTIIETTVKRY